MTKELILPSGHITLIDTEDWELIRQYRWAASVGEWGIYVIANNWHIGGKDPLKMHRLILNAPANRQVDHKNHDGLDNRRGNLRLATPSQNGGNTRIGKNNTSGYKGVSWHKTSHKWVAAITINYKKHSLGLWSDPWKAAQAYNTAALKAWGEFALLNDKLPEGQVS